MPTLGPFIPKTTAKNTVQIVVTSVLVQPTILSQPISLVQPILLVQLTVSGQVSVSSSIPPLSGQTMPPPRGKIQIFLLCQVKLM